MEAMSSKIQMVRFNGDFCENEVRNFIRGLPANQNITVVSIIGPRSTGKSYLLNRLFETDFRVLDCNQNHGETTEGIWIAKCTNNPSMVILDVEGFDARNRAEDGTSFEYRAALLALTISDILLLNIPAYTHGQYYGGFLPLLRTIFQERESLPPARTRVVVTLRDCQNQTNTGDQDKIRRVMEEIWESVSSSNKRLEDYIEVSAIQFPDATNESQFEAFEMKLAELRQQISPAGIRHPQHSPLNAATFLNSVQEIWANIRTNESLNIPSFNEWFSRHRCETIIEAELSSLDSSEEFYELRNMQDPISPKLFQKKLEEFLLSTLARFDAKAAGCVITVKDPFKAKLRREIITKLEGTLVRILMTKKNGIVEDSKVAISNNLWNTKRGMLSSIFTLTFNLEAFDNKDVDSIVYPPVTMFDDIFRDYCEEYRELVTIFSNELKNALEDYTEQVTKEIEKQHKIFVFTGKCALLAAVCSSCVMLETFILW